MTEEDMKMFKLPDDLSDKDKAVLSGTMKMVETFVNMIEKHDLTTTQACGVIMSQIITLAENTNAQEVFGFFINTIMDLTGKTEKQRHSEYTVGIEVKEKKECRG